MKSGNRQVWNALTLVFQFGINMIVPILMCTLFGVWVGEKFDITWIVIPLFIMGALAGFNNVYRMARSVYDKEDREKKQNKKGRKNAEKNK